MMKKTFYVQFEDPSIQGKGGVNKHGYNGWFEMDQVSGFDVVEDFYNRAAHIFNQHFHKPNQPGEVQMTAYYLNAIHNLLKAKISGDVIKKVTIHRMKETDDGLKADKGIVINNARITSMSNDPHTNHTEIFISGFAVEELYELEQESMDAAFEPFHLEYDAAKELNRI